jgi:hypothetical protein
MWKIRRIGSWRQDRRVRWVEERIFEGVVVRKIELEQVVVVASEVELVPGGQLSAIDGYYLRDYPEELLEIRI